MFEEYSGLISLRVQISHPKKQWHQPSDLTTFVLYKKLRIE